MSTACQGTFAYADRSLGDQDPLVVATEPDVFLPTSTTVLLLRAVRKALAAPPRSALDLGCGCGIVSLALAERVGAASVFASDLSPAAVRLTRENARRHGVAIDARQGSIFEPWSGMRFDLIVDDVAGIADPIAAVTPWYPPPVPCDAGEDGTRWILNVLAEAPHHLNPGGRLFFPVLSLSRSSRILDEARRTFASIEALEEQWYPLTEELATRFDVMRRLAAEGVIEIQKRGSRWCWASRIYMAR